MPIAIRADVPVRKLLVDCRCGSAKVEPGQVCQACAQMPSVNRDASVARVRAHGEARDARARQLYGE